MIPLLGGEVRPTPRGTRGNGAKGKRDLAAGPEDHFYDRRRPFVGLGSPVTAGEATPIAKGRGGVSKVGRQGAKAAAVGVDETAALRSGGSAGSAEGSLNRRQDEGERVRRAVQGHGRGLVENGRN